jgi:hypothetical protein
MHIRRVKLRKNETATYGTCDEGGNMSFELEVAASSTMLEWEAEWAVQKRN